MDAANPRPFAARRLLSAVLAAVLLTCGAGAARAVAADPVIMAAGDIACNSTGVDTPGPCSDLWTSNKAISQQASPEGLAALLAIGDTQYANGTTSEYANGFSKSWGRPELRSVLRPVPGNHEYNTGGAAGYFGYFGSILPAAQFGGNTGGWYSFDVGSWHIVGLNSSDVCKKVSCAAGSPQEQWLKSDLAATRAASQQSCILAFLHHPLSSAPLAKDLWQDMYDYGVDFVLTGHKHGWEPPRAQNPSGVSDPNGPREVVVGTGGKDGSAFGLLKMTLRNGSTDWAFDGTVDASGSATCHGSATPPPPPPPPPAPDKPTAGFKASATNLQVAFTDTSSGKPSAWLWNFGDGQSAGSLDPADDQIQNPTHTYAKAGTYTVTLTAHNEGGNSTPISQQIKVTAPAPPPAGGGTAGPGGNPGGTPGSDATPPGGTQQQTISTPFLPIATPPAPVVIPPVTGTSSVRLSVSTGRAAIRKALSLRLRGWRITDVTCRSTRARTARCTFKARRGRGRASGTGSLTLPSTGGAVGFRLKVSVRGTTARTLTWTGRTRP
jgi:PKD repeat protein